MATQTPNLKLSLIPANTALGYALANENFIKLDWQAGGMKLVTATATNSPPGGPANGDAYWIGTGTGAWSGHNGEIAIWSDDGVGGSDTWVFFTPATGMTFYALDTFEHLGFHATYGFHPLADRWSATESWTGRFHGGTAAVNKIYAKLVSIGAMPGNAPSSNPKSVAHGISNLDLDAPIDVMGWSGTTTFGQPFPRGMTILIDVTVDATNVNLETTFVGLNVQTGWVLLRYRKTV